MTPTPFLPFIAEPAEAGAQRQAEFFEELAAVPPCSLCGARAYRPGCLRCDARKRMFTPPTQAERAERIAASLAATAEARAREAIELERIATLRARPLPLDIALVGCGKSKRTTAAVAAELYTGSLFRASLRYARARFDQLFIVSALYGALPLDQVVEPYELSLTQLRNAERAAWGGRVASFLAGRYPFEHVRVTVFAGAEYVRWIAARLPRSWTVRTPLAGLPLGARLAALAERSSLPLAA